METLQKHWEMAQDWVMPYCQLVWDWWWGLPQGDYLGIISVCVLLFFATLSRSVRRYRLYRKYVYQGCDSSSLKTSHLLHAKEAGFIGRERPDPKTMVQFTEFWQVLEFVLKDAKAYREGAGLWVNTIAESNSKANKEQAELFKSVFSQMLDTHVSQMDSMQKAYNAALGKLIEMFEKYDERVESLAQKVYDAGANDTSTIMTGSKDLVAATAEAIDKATTKSNDDEQ